MADIADMAAEIEGEHLARALAKARVPIAAGVAGECEECGDTSPRLVGGRCAPCRDGRTRVAPVVRSVERIGEQLVASAPDVCGALRRAGESIGSSGLMATVRREMAKQEDAMGVEKQRQVTIVAKGDVLAAIEAGAAAGSGAMGPAALALIERGMMLEAAPPALAAAEAGMPRQRMVALLDGVQALVTGLIEAADAAGDTKALEEQLGAAIERAETAEAKLVSLRSLLG